jgi:hypothetical protein
VSEWTEALERGAAPTVIDVARWWREAEATAYRRNRDFRELFPGEPNPERFARQLVEQRKRRPQARSDDAAGVLVLTVTV